MLAESMDLPEPLEPVFTRYRRNMPHWRLTGATYFVTWTLATGQPALTPAERDRVIPPLRHFDGDRYELLAFVVMDDHVHVLCQADGRTSAGKDRRFVEVVHREGTSTARTASR